MFDVEVLNNLPLLTKVCLVAISLHEEEYEVLEFLKRVYGDKFESIHDAALKVIPVYDRMLGDESNKVNMSSILDDVE